MDFLDAGLITLEDFLQLAIDDEGVDLDRFALGFGLVCARACGAGLSSSELDASRMIIVSLSRHKDSNQFPKCSRATNDHMKR